MTCDEADKETPPEKEKTFSRMDRLLTRADEGAWEERFRKLLNVGHLGVAVGRPDKGLVEFNDAFCEMLGYTRRELMEKQWDELTHPEDLAEDQRQFERMLAGDLPGYTMEKRYFRKDGAVLHVRISVTCLRRPDGSAKETFGIIQDISEQKQLNQSLREHQRRLEETLASRTAALEEKEALLREVNHRVKNNLQVLVSMLRLQSQRDDRPGVFDALTHAIQRIMAMSIVHESIHGAPSLAQIELCDYVSDLVRGLCGTFDNGSGIAVSSDIETGIRLDADRAVSCGMVLNELITNAIKHAFPDGNGGCVTIKGRRTADGRVCVAVRDDGVGLPPGLDWRRAESLGLMMIVGLVENQLDGDIVKEDGPGVSFSFTFEDIVLAAEPAGGS